MAYKESSNKAKLARLKQDILGDGIKESKLEKYVEKRIKEYAKSHASNIIDCTETKVIADFEVNTFQLPFNSNYFNENKHFFKVYETLTKEAFRKNYFIIGKVPYEGEVYTVLMAFEPQSSLAPEYDNVGMYYAPFGWGDMMPKIKLSIDEEAFKAAGIYPYRNGDLDYYGSLGGPPPFMGGWVIEEQTNSSDVFCSNLGVLHQWTPFVCIIPLVDTPELEIKYYDSADTMIGGYGEISLVTTKTIHDLKVGNAYYYHLKNGELVLDDIVKVQVRDFT